jgi:hypothetical protein
VRGAIVFNAIKDAVHTAQHEGVRPFTGRSDLAPSRIELATASLETRIREAFERVDGIKNVCTCTEDNNDGISTILKIHLFFVARA